MRGAVTPCFLPSSRKSPQRCLVGGIRGGGMKGMFLTWASEDVIQKNPFTTHYLQCTGSGVDMLPEVLESLQKVAKSLGVDVEG